ERAHERASLDRDKHAIRDAHVGFDPPNMMRVGASGKLQVSAEGSARNPARSTQLSPPLSERNTALGSVPAYTIPNPSACPPSPTSTAVTIRWSMPRPTGFQFRPLSRLRNRPARAVPQYTWAGLLRSIATHPGDSPAKWSATVQVEAARAINTAARVTTTMLNLTESAPLPRNA